MATWTQVNRLPFLFTGVCCNASKQLFQANARPSSFRPASTDQVPTADCNRAVDVGVTRDGDTIVCFHPAPDIPYELTKPVPSPDPAFDSAETHDLVLKSQLHKDSVKARKSPAIEELAKMFYTTKHRWYPVGQYHTRRRNRNPPKDR